MEDFKLRECGNTPWVLRKEAGQIAIDKYYNGEILLEPGHLVNKKLFICDEDTSVGKDWMEF